MIRKAYYRLVLVPLYYALGLYRVQVQTPPTFTFRGRIYSYMYHWYGKTYLIERAVEIPIAWERVSAARAESKRILEVGNVLSHFFPTDHDVVDKYERAPGVLNEDVVDFRPESTYDLIVSVSTLEHVGFDEEGPDSPDKVARAFENLRECLAPSGELFFTFPLGYNPAIDRLVRNGSLALIERAVMKRVSHYSNRWEEVGWEDVRDPTYGRPFRSGNWIFFGTMRRD
jgi:SAM-dependent methyltransferase